MPYKDPEKKRVHARADREAHRDERNASNRARYAAHREAYAATHRAYYVAHKEAICCWQKTYHANHREERKPQRRANHLLQKYGLTVAAFEALLQRQGGACAICGASEWGGRHGAPCIDHNHVTGNMRGIICNNCNVAIGRLKDNPRVARAAADYLEGQVNTLAPVEETND